MDKNKEKLNMKSDAFTKISEILKLIEEDIRDSGESEKSICATLFWRRRWLTWSRINTVIWVDVSCTTKRTAAVMHKIIETVRIGNGRGRNFK